jgi:hypothetical protein
MKLQTHHYDISRLEASPSLAEKVAVFLAVTCLMFGFHWLIESLLRWEHRSGIEALIMPIVVGVWCAFTAFQGGSVIIGQDFIEGRTLVGQWTFKKRIGREQIKSISENKRGLRIMDRGKSGSLMLGSILVPATMPEYKEIKSILSGWAPVQAQR